MKKRYEIRAAGKSAEVYIYEDIGDGLFGGLSAQRFANDLKTVKGKDLNVYINSYGGSVFDGIAIYNQLKRHTGRVSVSIDGIAASIASVIAMAGDEISIAENGFLMIHDPWGIAMGTADEFRAQAEQLDKVRDTLVQTYASRTGMDEGEIANMMAEETWMAGDEAVAQGFADSLTEQQRLAAYSSDLLSKFSKPPEAVRAAAETPAEPEEPSEPRAPHPNVVTMRQRLRERRL